MENKKEDITQQPDNQEPETKTSQAETAEGKGQEAKAGKRDWSLGKIFQSIMAGTFLTRENVIRSIPYLFFLAFLGLVYIANTYYAEKTVRAIDHTKRELKELRYEHITVKSELMYLSKQSEVSRRLDGSGLKPSVTPPFKIYQESKNNQKTK